MTAEPGPLGSDLFLEIACFNLKSLMIADGSGADRTEFCVEKASGGVTPPLDDVLGIIPHLQNPVHIMIRPRGGNFVYSALEFEQMKHDIHTIQLARGKLGGFVFGILETSGRVDMSRNSDLVALAQPLPCTFHRAFDETRDLDESLEDVIACGFKTVLTSGGAADAVAGAEVLGRLVGRAKERIALMPGGSVRSSNIELLKDKTKAKWYHSSAIVDGDDLSVEEIRLMSASLRRGEIILGSAMSSGKSSPV